MSSVVYKVPTKKIASWSCLSYVQVDHLIDSVFNYFAICRMQSFILFFLERTLDFETASADVS